jgi:hypothetical protein
MPYLNLQYFSVDERCIRDICKDTVLVDQFLAFVKDSYSWISLPWGDYVVDLSSWVVTKEDHDLQEQVFTDMPLPMQNLVYELDQLKFAEDPNSQALLVYSLIPS